MAKRSLSNQNNVSGDLFVDTRCIGCHVCERVAPNTFALEDSLSYVKKQPENEQEMHKALIALLSCPVFSIGLHQNRSLINEAAKQLPQKLHENVYFCGFNDRSSFGASSYFIQRDEGNILIDSPRFDPRLVSSIEKLGGIKYIYLTHKDDIADYAKFKSHFQAGVIYHEDDFTSKIKSADITLKGTKAYRLDQEIEIIPQPGHTKGHTVLLYKNYYLFSGDHLAYDSKQKHLYAFKNYCWYDWQTQLDSLSGLSNYSFSFLLPGHGEMFHSDQETMYRLLHQYIKTQ